MEPNELKKKRKSRTKPRVELWKFEDGFKISHPTFFPDLLRHAKLTPTELDVAAMVCIGMHSQDIADLLGISLDTVNNHRYSIRKKIGFVRDDNLREFLMKI